MCLKVGYIRVSTDEQNTARQEAALADCEKIYIDRCSGKNTDRPELEKMLIYVRAGDTVLVESFSRLARSTSDLLRTVDLLRRKGVKIVSLKEKFDTSTAAGKFMLITFAALAEFERDLLLERQREGIIAAHKLDEERIKKGLPPVKYRGRPAMEIDQDLFEKEYNRWKAGKQTAITTARRIGVCKTTFYKLVNNYEKKGKTP